MSEEDEEEVEKKTEKGARREEKQDKQEKELRRWRQLALDKTATARVPWGRLREIAQGNKWQVLGMSEGFTITRTSLICMCDTTFLQNCGPWGVGEKRRVPNTICYHQLLYITLTCPKCELKRGVMTDNTCIYTHIYWIIIIHIYHFFFVFYHLSVCNQ